MALAEPWAVWSRLESGTCIQMKILCFGMDVVYLMCGNECQFVGEAILECFLKETIQDGRIVREEGGLDCSSSPFSLSLNQIKRENLVGLARNHFTPNSSSKAEKVAAVRFVPEKLC